MGAIVIAALPTALAVVAALLAAIGDLRSGRVPNWLTYGALACGLVLGLAAGGPRGALRAFIGAVIAFAPPFFLFLANRSIGGGDAKLLAALGALLYRHDRGEHLAVGLEIFILATVIASVFALFILARRGMLISSFTRVLRTITGSVVPGVRPREPAEPSPKMRFTPMIALATLAVVTRTAERAYEVIL